MLYRDQRAATAKETKALTPAVIRTTGGATLESTYHSDLLPSLGKPKISRTTHVHVENGDTYTVAQYIIKARQLDENKSQPPTRVAVLNLASDRHAGGGWLKGALAQEEALCLRSTLAATLKDSYYPLAAHGAVWSPGVVVFRDEISKDCQLYEDKDDRFLVGVVSVAGLRHPPLTSDDLDYKKPADTELMLNKMRQMLRIMASNSITHCVLGALGCGVFGNPPRRVAQLFKKVITEDEFKGHFDEIVFAILDPKKEGNLRTFEGVIGDFTISAE